MAKNNSEYREPWWDTVRTPIADGGVSHWADTALALQCLKNRTALYKGSCFGNVGSKAKKIIEQLEAMQPGHLLQGKAGDGIGGTWVWDTGFCSLSYYEHENEVDVSVTAVDKNLVEMMVKLVKSNIIPRKSMGRVYVIGTAPMGGYTFYNLGMASVKLERENYSDDVIKVYDGIVADLNSVSPSGRLSIFDGPPGTGKTFLIRGILQAVENAMFVLVPPEMMNILASPEMIPLLIRKKASNDIDGPVIFILEDGDNVLIPRKKENLSLISSLLNFSSGILGSMLDVRVITTTNSPKVDIDPALMRAGRLSDHITVGRLDDKKAAAILARLLKKKTEMPSGDKQPTLADVYKHARNAGWRPPAVSKANGMESAVSVPEGRTVRVVNSRLLGEDFVIHPKVRGWDSRV